MALNGYVVLSAFFSVLGLATAVATVGLATSTLLRMRLTAWRGEQHVEDRVYLTIQLTYALLGLTLASWIVLYLLLETFVPLWPGAMCIYGITQIGEGSRGVTGWLPSLVIAMQAMKPLVAFAAGAALVLYRLYRRSGVSELLPRVLCALLVVALLGTVSSAAELAYLSIPKLDIPVNSGCCSAAAVDADAIAPPSSDERWLTPVYYGCHLLMAWLLWPRRGQAGGLIAYGRLAAGLLLSLLTLVVAGRFVVDVAAPALLHLPYHHCLYDLVADVPESGVALGLLLWGTCCVGWACVAGWLGRSAATEALVAAEARHWQSCAMLGYLGTAAMFSVELWLA
ncbi:MAG TPA: hypothetical protein VJ783_03585 [Pirellulales bacterium]|nr:hypothetical protein [Pirellulales bacterium]